MGRRIVLCFDGTGDWAGSDDTNVLKIFKAIKRDDPDTFAYYDGGVGTLVDATKLSRTGKVTSQLLDLGLATSLRDKVLAGYSFLIENYIGPDDKIFMFGFSRGSYTARVLAGMIHTLGLLKQEHANLAPYVWQTYSNFNNFSQFRESADEIRNDFARDVAVQIRFMGLFDTVSSVGVLDRFKTFPYTDYNPSVLEVRHAVSIDERRNVFPECLFAPYTPGLVEVWFPGVHRDVGGGYLPSESGLPNVTLEWIAREANNSGLPLKDGALWPPQISPMLHEPGIDPYVAAGFYPMNFWEPLVHNFRALWPNFWHSRCIPEGALVDVGIEHIDGYTPSAKHGQYVLCDPLAEPVQQPDRYQPTVPRIRFADFIGTALGTLLTLFIFVMLCSWPLSNALGDGAFSLASGLQPFVLNMHQHWLGYFWSLLIACLLIVIVEGFRKKLQPWAIVIAPAAFAVYLIGLYLRNQPSSDLMRSYLWFAVISLGIGIVLWLVAQFPGLPALSTDRVLPRFASRWLVVAIGWTVLSSATVWLLDLRWWADNSPWVWPVLAVLGLALTSWQVDSALGDQASYRQNVQEALSANKHVRYRGTKKVSRWLIAITVLCIVAAVGLRSPQPANASAIRAAVDACALAALALLTMDVVVSIFVDRFAMRRSVIDERRQKLG